MLTGIWVLGSMLLMLLIHFLLPLGYTTKGKIVVVLSSGLLALAGIASTIAIPVWQTFIVLLALSFFAAYILDRRLGKSMYRTKEQFKEEIELEDVDSSLVLTKQTEKTLDDIEVMDLSELEITSSAPVNKREESREPADSLEEDISFLQEREIVSNGDEELENDDGELEVGYLSDIESLLEDSEEEKVESLDEQGWLDELAELTLVNEEEKSPVTEIKFDDFELEELFADNEAAATSDDKDSKPKKVLELQK